MRHDMFKVIVERPRAGRGYAKVVGNYYRRAKRFVLDEDGEVVDEFCGIQPILPKRGDDRKSLNENLSPLRRYLQSQVGRRWDEVYSEIRANLVVGKAVHEHILQHLYQYIEVKCYLSEGKVYACDRKYWSSLHEVGGLYVCPSDGTIKDTVDHSIRKTSWREKAQAELEKVCYVVNNNLAFVWLDGIWYRVDMKPAKDLLEERTYINIRGEKIVNVIDHSIKVKYLTPENNNFKLYSAYKPWKKSTACKKDLLRYGLSTTFE